MSRAYVHNRNKEDNMNLEFEGRGHAKDFRVGDGGIDTPFV